MSCTTGEVVWRSRLPGKLYDKCLRGLMWVHGCQQFHYLPSFKEECLWHLQDPHNCKATKADTFQWHKQVMTWHYTPNLKGAIWHDNMYNCEEVYTCTYCNRHTQALQSQQQRIVEVAERQVHVMPCSHHDRSLSSQHHAARRFAGGKLCLQMTVPLLKHCNGCHVNAWRMPRGIQ